LLKVGKKVGAQDHHVGKSKLFTYRYNWQFERKMALRITMWVNQNFLLPTELQPAPKLDIKFLSLRFIKMINLYNYNNYFLIIITIILGSHRKLFWHCFSWEQKILPRKLSMYGKDNYNFF
jgi:hypothetical protein